MTDTHEHEPEDAITNYVAFLKATFGDEAGARYARQLGFTDPVSIPPTPSAPTEIDPETPALPEYRGTLRMHGAYGYISPDDRTVARDDYRVVNGNIFMGTHRFVLHEPVKVAFNLGTSALMGYTIARDVVVLDNPASIAAYANRKPRTPRQNPPRSLADHIARKAERTETRTPIEGVYVDKAKLLTPGSAEHAAWRDSIPAGTNTQIVVRTSEGYEIDEHPNLIDLDF